MDQETLNQLLQEVNTMQESGRLEMGELLEASDELRQLLIWMVRQKQFEVADVAEQTGLGSSGSKDLINALLRKGILHITDSEKVDKFSTTMRFVPKYKVPEDIWKALED